MERASADSLGDPARGDARMRYENSYRHLLEVLGGIVERGRRQGLGTVQMRDVSNVQNTTQAAHVVPLHSGLPTNPPLSPQNTPAPALPTIQYDGFNELFALNPQPDSMFPLSHNMSFMDLDTNSSSLTYPSPNDLATYARFPFWTMEPQPTTLTQTITVRPLRPSDSFASGQRETEQARESREEEEDDGLSSMDEFSGEEEEGEEEEEEEEEDLEEEVDEEEEEEVMEEETEAHTEEMAESVDDDENVRTTASCPVCLLEYRNDDRNRIARVLSCGHMICTRCAEEFLRNKEREQATVQNATNRMYPCHICRKKVCWTNLAFVKEVAYLYNQVIQMQAQDPTSQIAIKREARKILKRHHSEVEELATKMKTDAENLAALSKRVHIALSSSIRSTSLSIEAINNEEQLRSFEETTRTDSEVMETIEREFRNKCSEMAALLKSAIDPSNESTSSQ